MRIWYRWMITNSEVVKYSLEEVPWWIFLLNEINLLIYYVISCCFSWIKLPTFLYYYNRESKELYTWREWYGDLGQVYHLYICDPIFQWCQKRIKRIWIDGEVNE